MIFSRLESCKIFFQCQCLTLSRTERADLIIPTWKEVERCDNFSKNNCFVPTQAEIFCTALPSPDQCICNANQLSSSSCTTRITWKNLFNIRGLIGADEWLWHDIHGIEIQLKTASGTEVVVIVQHVPWDLCWNTAISCAGWEILGVFLWQSVSLQKVKLMKNTESLSCYENRAKPRTSCIFYNYG